MGEETKRIEGLTKRATKKAEKAVRREQEASVAHAFHSSKADPLTGNYGDRPLSNLQSKEVVGRRGMKIHSLVEEINDEEVLIRGWVQTIRAVGKNMAFLVLRRLLCTVQYVVIVAPELVILKTVKYAAGLNKEWVVDVQGIVTVPSVPIKGTSQQVELQVREIYCIRRAVPNLPFNIEDASLRAKETEDAKLAGEMLVSVG